jgi:hypothetical protein
MAKKGAKVKTAEQKADDFKKAAKKKVNTILRGFDGLAKLANPNKYAHTPAELKKMQEAISEAADGAFETLQGKRVGASGFDFN